VGTQRGTRRSSVDHVASAEVAILADDQAVPHWRCEVVTFQRDAAQRFAPSMRRRIDLDRLYRDAMAAVAAIRSDDPDEAALPGSCPFTLERLLTAPIAGLVGTARDASAG
jgi:hypothetical protein